jgi:hypothetical protein
LAVADGQSRVHGMERPLVVDVPIMTAVTSTNTNTSAIVIAETGAVVTKAAARERLAA